jgi:DNA repair exonuclease SbcCD nuclease subunit
MGRRILHLADLHLGFSQSYLGPRASERVLEADGVLERIADWIVHEEGHGIGAVLIAGDLFDSPWPDESTVERAVQPLRRLTSAGIAVVTVPGNHDELTYPDGIYSRWSTSWPGLLVTSTHPEQVATLDFEDFPVEIASCAYRQGRNPPSDEWANPFAGPRDPDIRRVGLFHGTLDRIGGIIAEGERAFRLDLERLAAWDLDYIALGHIHRRQSFREGPCLAHYPGPIEGMGFSDPGNPVLTLVDLSEAVPTTIPIDALAVGIRSRDVRSIEIDLLRVADHAELVHLILQETDEELPLPIRRVVLTGHAEVPVDPAELERELGERFLKLEVRFEGSLSEIGDWEKLSEQRTLEGIFVKKILEKRDAADSQTDPFWDRVAVAGLRALGRGQQ